MGVHVPQALPGRDVDGPEAGGALDGAACGRRCAAVGYLQRRAQGEARPRRDDRPTSARRDGQGGVGRADGDRADGTDARARARLLAASPEHLPQGDVERAGQA
eukprot:6231962-Prymnesium_polylepis.1